MTITFFASNAKEHILPFASIFIAPNRNQIQINARYLYALARLRIHFGRATESVYNVANETLLSVDKTRK